MSQLVIVESPAKAKTISRILGKEYVVEASYGHVRDLPEKADQIPAKYKKQKWSRLGVNVEKGFEPLYIVPDDKKKYVKRLKDAMKGVDAILLATDEDREGESISWHVIEVLKPTVPVYRIAFHEITDEAIRAAVASPRDLNEDLVRAQESRRILDRLYGYMLSPVLWKKVRRGLSAGRVQSVAVRLCVIRERERRSFRMAAYWDAEATFEKDGITFPAKLARLDGVKVAGGQDFDLNAGALKEGSPAHWLKDEAAARSLIDALEKPFTINKVEQKPIRQRPSPPFVTASLQQEANRKLGFSASQTMRIAQRLYEGIDVEGERVGLITYMRTDSVTLSQKALGDCEAQIKAQFGDDYTTGPRAYKTKSANAQEAHEAIRPSEVSRTPDALAETLDHDSLRLYDLIWKRTIASQMADAALLRTSVEIVAEVGSGHDAAAASFTASGKQIKFPGYLRAYVEGSDDPDADIADREFLLPALVENAAIDPLEIEAKSHETLPPARYTEASIVKKLEAEGIGRPSTYASIIETVQRRGYVVKEKNALIPTFTAFCVTQLLEKHFADYVDLQFTRKMEQTLDDISNGKLDWREHLQAFYHGNGTPGLEARIAENEPLIEYPTVLIGTDPESGEPVVAKVGRYGPYLQVGTETEGDRKIASIPTDIAPADLTIEDALEIIRQKEAGPRTVGIHPELKEPIYVMTGRFGPYVQVGDTPTEKKAPKPQRASVPKETLPEDLTLDEAMKLLSLPRTLGTHPDSGEEIVAAKGRFGPYIKCADDSRSLRAKAAPDVYEITLEEALEIFKQPKKARGKRQAKKKVLKALGADPDTKAEIEILDGMYGAYLTNGTLNAKMEEGMSVESMTLEEALAHLASNGRAPKRRR